jgi:hypothetical protein
VDEDACHPRRAHHGARRRDAGDGRYTRVAGAGGCKPSALLKRLT